MKGRLIIIAGLAVLLIGIAFVRAILSHQDSQPVLDPAVTRAVPTDILDDYIEKEAALRQIDSVRSAYDDSVGRLRQELAALDSAATAADADSLTALIEKLQTKVTTAEATARDAKRARQKQFEKLVVAFYRGEKQRLPADLSSYEREVSLKEIRSKALAYFDLTARELNRIIAGEK